MSSFVAPSSDTLIFLFWNRSYGHVSVAGKILKPTESTSTRDQPVTDRERAILLRSDSRWIESALRLASEGQLGVREVVSDRVLRLPFSPSVVGLRVVDAVSLLGAEAVEVEEIVEEVKEVEESMVPPKGLSFRTWSPDIDPSETVGVPSEVVDPPAPEDDAVASDVAESADVDPESSGTSEPEDAGTGADAGEQEEGEGDPEDPGAVEVRIVDAAVFAEIPWEEIEQRPDGISMQEYRYFGTAFEPEINDRSRAGIVAQLLEARDSVSN